VNTVSFDTPTANIPGKQCVRCGKCLAVCPFYRVTRREECSPRGRVLLSERFDRSDAVRCFACLRCAKVCPYELSPLDRPGQRFGPGDDQSLRPLFDLIYYRTLPAPDSSADPLTRAWLATRAGEAIPGGAPRFGNGELYHPFLDGRAS